jgi:exosortase/archaeosortase family protein
MPAQKNKEPIRFVVTFLVLFLAFYYFNILFFGLTSPGSHYNNFLANHLNYIDWLRWILLKCSTKALHILGFTAINNKYELLVAGRGIIRLVYTCLGLGVMSFFAAFVIAYPKSIKPKLIFLICGLLSIQFLNVVRFVILALFWDKHTSHIVDHHTIFNIFIYIAIVVSLYFWIKPSKTKANVAN